MKLLTTREWRNDEYIRLGKDPPYLDRPAADMLDNILVDAMGYGIHSGHNMHISRHTFQMVLYAMMTGDWQKFMEYER